MNSIRHRLAKLEKTAAWRWRQLPGEDLAPRILAHPEGPAILVELEAIEAQAFQEHPAPFPDWRVKQDFHWSHPTLGPRLADAYNRVLAIMADIPPMNGA